MLLIIQKKNDSYYPEIVDNINYAAKFWGLILHVNLNPDWEGDENFHIEYE